MPRVTLARWSGVKGEEPSEDVSRPITSNTMKHQTQHKITPGHEHVYTCPSPAPELWTECYSNRSEGSARRNYCVPGGSRPSSGISANKVGTSYCSARDCMCKPFYIFFDQTKASPYTSGPFSYRSSGTYLNRENKYFPYFTFSDDICETFVCGCLETWVRLSQQLLQYYTLFSFSQLS